MITFSKILTIAVLLFGLSMHAADETKSTVERSVGASSGEVTFTETIFEERATFEREATHDKKNNTFKAEKTTHRLYCEPLVEKLENQEDIFKELKEKHRKKQENKKGPGDETNITNPDNKKKDPLIVDEWKEVKKMGYGRGIKVYHNTVFSLQDSDGEEIGQFIWKYTVDD